MSNAVIEFFQQHTIKGFLAEDEGQALYQIAMAAAPIGPCLEVGSYCGKSTVYLGMACKAMNNTLYAVDHHRGSEEHQIGEEYHDADLKNHTNSGIDSFPLFRKTLQLSELEETVVPLVCSSAVAVKDWATPLGLVFIDGGHSPEMSRQDCLSWSEKIAVGGCLAIHDIFEKPSDGGQGPYWAMEAVLAEGDFVLRGRVNSLAMIQRIKARVV